MDAEDVGPLHRDALKELEREDLDRLSRHELTERIARLEAEIERARERLGAASSTRASADALFARPADSWSGRT